MLESIKQAPAVEPAASSPASDTAADTNEIMQRNGGRMSRLRTFLPTILAFALLAAVGIWGHETGWKVPKFSQWLGGDDEKPDDWCKEHTVPEVICVECNPDLMPRDSWRGWCRTHGVSECPLCHPEVAQVKGPPPKPKYDVKAALDVMPRPENNSLCKKYQRRIQFASAEAVLKAGIDVERVIESSQRPLPRPMTDAITAHGEVGYDPTRVVRLSSRVPGTVWEVFRSVGERADRDEIMALVDAAEIGKAKTEYANALVQVQLKTKILAGLKMAAGVIEETKIEEAAAALEEARLRRVTAEQALLNFGFSLPSGLEKLGARDIVHSLRFLGIPSFLADRLDARMATANLFPIRTPRSGIVVVCEVVTGEVVEASKVLMVVADVEHMWLTMHVRQEDARYLALDRPVRFHPDGGSSDREGKIAWISTAVEEKTRTVKVRVDLPNPDGKLRANTFGTGTIILRHEPNAIVVPHEAVQWEGCCHIVFVRDKNYFQEGTPKVFHVRQVRLGAKDEQYVEILAGLLRDEVVVTTGSAILQGELLRANFGLG